MLAKIFLPSFLATLLAVGVVATPIDVEARSAGPVIDAGTAVTALKNVITTVENAVSPPGGSAIIPKKGDVLVASAGVKARDLESLEKRTPGCIFVTVDPNFTGISGIACGISNGACTNFDTFWRSNISSFRPDQAAVCRVFTGLYCTGTASVYFGYPGYGNLGIFDNNIGSFACWW